MANTTKQKSQFDGNQTLQQAYNDVDATLSVNGFIVGKVGHKVTLTIGTTNVSNDTEVFAFFDGSTQLYEITLIYTDDSREILQSAERTA